MSAPSESRGEENVSMRFCEEDQARWFRSWKNVRHSKTPHCTMRSCDCVRSTITRICSYLAIEYLSLAMVIGSAVVFAEYRDVVGPILVLERAGICDRDHSDRRLSSIGWRV